LNAHQSILRDVSLVGQIHEYITQGDSAEVAVMHAAEYFRDVLRSSESAYIRERTLDLKDVATQLLRELGVEITSHALTLTEHAVIFAENLTPQELLGLDRKLIAGLVLEYAGATSHTVILARSLGIAALAGVTGGQHCRRYRRRAQAGSGCQCSVGARGTPGLRIRSGRNWRLSHGNAFCRPRCCADRR